MMGFGKDAELIEKTSFKTKMVEYLNFQKPIIVWGPHYCSAVKIAEKYNSALICTSPDPMELISKILLLRERPNLAKDYVKNAAKMYQAEFEPNRICKMALEKFRELY